jgi:A/G-specific adenine glycosylase
MEGHEKNQVFTSQLLSWYETEKRELPWRNTKDPYQIWLSEIILQQTRIQQGLPYYLKFTKTYPTIEDLAAADLESVLRLWQGLGYYSRARNLHACAQQVVKDYGGAFPADYDELLKLKGIGKYTAAAIASFAFDKPTAVVDGNVFRVLSRYFGIADDISEPKSFKIFEKKANALIPAADAANFNQAIMDFGAIQCKPKNPHCALCPVSSSCFAFNQGMISSLPVKTKKVKVRKRFFHYLIISHENRFLLKSRDAKDIWQGLYDFALHEFTEPTDIEKSLTLLGEQSFEVKETSPIIKHVLTHQQIFAQFISLKVRDFDTFDSLKNAFDCEDFSPEEIEALPKPILIENYLKESVF